MAVRKSPTAVITKAEKASPLDAAGQVLKFDFGGPRPQPSKLPADPEEKSTIKEAIIRWLDEQL